MVLLLGTFVASRVAYYAAGLGGLTLPEHNEWHYVDTVLLREHLLRSIYHLHSQPPAFNLLFGIALKMPDGTGEWMIRQLLRACGFGLYASLFRLMVRLGVRPVLAFVVATGFIVSPSVVLFENIFFYPVPLAFVLTLSALLLLRFLEGGHASRALAFFAAVGLLVCIQSTFHPVYVLLVGTLVVVVHPTLRRRVAMGAAVPAALILALCLKNAVLFESYGLSSWLGMSLGRVILVNVPDEKKKALVDDRKVSPLVLIEPFSPLETYPASFQNVTGFDGIEELRNSRKANGDTNYNHLAYISISKQYLADCEYLVWHVPGAYLKGILRSFFVYTKSSTDYGFLVDMVRKITGLDAFYNHFLYGQVSVDAGAFQHIGGGAGDAYHLYVVLALGLPLLLLFGLRRSLEATRWVVPLSREQRTVLLYLCFNIIYVALVGNLVESGENNRFRFTTDPLSGCLLAIAFEGLLVRFRSRSPAPTTPPPDTGRRRPQPSPPGAT
jgi:hypothetical protein